MTEPTDPPTWNALAEVIAVMPHVYHQLLAEHVPDPASGKCRKCTVPGTGIPRAPWPCPLHKLATLAQNIHDRPLRGRSE